MATSAAESSTASPCNDLASSSHTTPSDASLPSSTASTIRTKRPSRRSPLAIDTSNPAPTPPPRSPLPALPPTHSALADFDAPILSLAGRASASSRAPLRRELSQSSIPPSTISDASRGTYRVWEGIDPSIAISEEPVSDAFLLEVLAEHGHHALDQWHNKGARRLVDELGALPTEGAATQASGAKVSDAARPRSRASVMSRKERRAIHTSSPSSVSTSAARTPTTPASPRTSIASDLISLSETSKSLHDLSKRLSGSYHHNTIRDSLEADFDPFEFDRFNSSPSAASRSARSSPSDASSRNLPIITRRPDSGSSLGSRRESNAPHLLALPPSANPAKPIVSRPLLRPSRSSTAVSQDLMLKSMDLADKRWNLEARRAELLGLPLPPKPVAAAPTALAPSESGTEFPPPLKRLPPRLHLASDDRPNTASSVASAATAGPGIIVRPSTASDNGCSTATPSRSTFSFNDQATITGSQFSPSSMTFGGDCHRSSRVPSPPPPVPSKRGSDLPALPVASKTREFAAPPVPPKDNPSTSVASTFFPADRAVSQSPELGQEITVQSTSGSKPSSPTAASDPSAPISPTRRIRRPGPNRVPSIVSLQTARNFSYPSDAFVEVKGPTETEDEDEDEDLQTDAYYYSHAQGAIGATGSVSAAGMVAGWAERNAALKKTPHEPVATVSVLHEEDEFSDSSLDLHTPLPALLVRAGVLSARSALMASGQGDKESIGPKTKQQKIAEMARGAGGKVISKNRLIRHRDGKNLGLGLGLTTGLGWSDSEDEDAPSPLRHHISQIILHKKESRGSFSTLASSASISNLSSQRESVLSTTTSSSHGSRQTSSIRSNSAKSAVDAKVFPQSKLRSFGLKGSQSMAQIATTLRPSLMNRQASMTIPGPTCPPSSFVGGRFGKVSASQASSISSISSIPQQATPVSHPPYGLSQSPASSSTSISTASSSLSPVTPSSESPNETRILVPPSPMAAARAGLSVVSENHKPVDSRVFSPNKTPRSSRPEMRRTASSSTTVTSGTPSNKSTSRSRSTSSNFNMPPPSSFGKGVPLPPTPAQSIPSALPTPTRKRTISSGSSTGAPPSSLPGRRTRTTSTSSAATNASTTLKSKTSLASIKSVAHSLSAYKEPSNTFLSSSFALHHSHQSSVSSTYTPPVMTVGSLAFPSPPPLSPAVVSMRLAQVQAERRKSGMSVASIATTTPPALPRRQVV